MLRRRIKSHIIYSVIATREPFTSSKPRAMNCNIRLLFLWHQSEQISTEAVYTYFMVLKDFVIVCT
jgi:hypothetical protein